MTHVVCIDGLWVPSAGSVKWADRWGPGGCGPWSLEFTVSVDPSDDSSWLRIGRTVECFDASGVLVFGGRISEVGRDYPRSVYARGHVRRADGFDALDAGAPTTNPTTALNDAMGRGLGDWISHSGFDATSFGDDTTAGTNRLGRLLDEWAVVAGKRWGVDAYGYVFARTDATEPTWWLDASGLDLGVADDGLFTRVNARYVSAVTSGEPSAWATETVDDAAGQALYGVVEYAMDLTALGLISSGTAASYAQAQLDLMTVPQWLSRVDATERNLFTAGGAPAHLASVRAGQVVRLFNVPNGLGGLRNELALDVVLGETEHSDDNPNVVPIAPVGLAVRNLLDTLVAAARATSDGLAA